MDARNNEGVTVQGGPGVGVDKGGLCGDGIKRFPVWYGTSLAQPSDGWYPLAELFGACYESSSVKEANEDANYRGGYFLVTSALSAHNIERLEGGVVGEVRGSRRKGEVYISGRMLPRRDVGTTEWLTPPCAPCGPTCGSSTTSKKSLVLITFVADRDTSPAPSTRKIEPRPQRVRARN
ncbi:hypothetical protein KM043_013754 [Ampulex compressa]|nr:hypothetical protein KM043_013754 [Ampulex compressa]